MAGGAAETGAIARRRLLAQRVLRTAFTSPEQVVAWLGAVQAQDYLGALWAVGLRMKAGTEASVEAALAERRIVRTWPMRGTLHFVAADDARWMTELLAGRPAARAAGRLRSFGIDEAVLRRARRVLEKRLAGGAPMTRPAAYRALEEAGIASGEQRGLHVLWRLAQDCVVCFGPRDGKQHTFVLFDEWLPRARSMPREEALGTLAERYFTSHGPATLADFVWWSGLTVTDARRAIAIAGSRIRGLALDGAPAVHWVEGGAAPRLGAGGAVHLLPSFDEMLVGYTDRGASVDAAVARRVIAGGIFLPVVVADGRVVGTWRRRTGRGAVACSTVPFVTWSQATRQAVRRATERYARFLGVELRAGE